MVRTRGARQSAEDSELAAPPAALSAVASAQSGKPDVPPQPELSVPADTDNDTIGSRLRKRRRTGSSTSEINASGNKRPNLCHASPAEAKKADSPERKRKLDNPKGNGEPSGSNGTVNGHSKASPQPTPRAPFQPSGQPQIEQIISLDTNVVNDNAIANSVETPPLSKPDYSAIIAEIVEHGVNVDRRYAQEYKDGDEEAVDTDSWQPGDASIHLKVQSLPILDNLSTQILNTLAKSTYQEICVIVTQPESGPGQAYATLKSLFDHTKKVYSIHENFLSATELRLTEQKHIDIIRKANLATFVSSVFGGQDVGFFYLDDHFLETFVPDGSRLLKSQGGLFLELKTQAYISAMTNKETNSNREDLLNTLFPKDIERRLLERRPGARSLAPSEADFVNRVRSRREHLLSEPDTDEAIQRLSEKYIWEDFLRDLCQYVSKNFDSIGVQAHARKPLKTRPSIYSSSEVRSQIQEAKQDRPERSEQSVSPEKQNGQIVQEDEPKQGVQEGLSVPTGDLSPGQPSFDINIDDIAEKAARAAEVALQKIHVAPNSQQNYQQQRDAQAFQTMNTSPTPQPQQNTPYADPNAIPYHTQSAPTQVLYERARQAATAKSSPTNRRAGVPSQRRPWTTEEENALMAGLDRVKGPHWSQILAMFGPGGTINESLKDRNQVQLKDKARNLKLFFLKSGIEVPYYLQFVTGELKTRAPAQAAKNEARERAKVQGSEDKAHIEGIMALAGSSQGGSETNGDSTMFVNRTSPTYAQNVAQSLQAATAAANAGAAFSGRATANLPAAYNYPAYTAAPMGSPFQSTTSMTANGLPNTPTHFGSGAMPSESPHMPPSAPMSASAAAVDSAERELSAALSAATAAATASSQTTTPKIETGNGHSS
ncbi:MAG: TTAGGG repeat binding factor [Cirrosporium novae-zelandiae]|nr:MAG: TTAGGG repeat binding factor [Cirrosporium novae-zelandiae]